MKIETPCGSGNTIEIYEGGNGNLCITIDAKDWNNKQSEVTVELLGIGGGRTTREQEALKKALYPFVEKL